MQRKCPNCEYTDTGQHWNSSSMLPPVGLPFFILKDGEELIVQRSSYSDSSSGDLGYGVFDSLGFISETISGRFSWRHV